MSEAIRLELRSNILEATPDWCATKWVLETIPFLFRGLEPVDFWSWKSQLANRIDVDPKKTCSSRAVRLSV
jgi:hypothetical protein